MQLATNLVSRYSCQLSGAGALLFGSLALVVGSVYQAARRSSTSRRRSLSWRDAA
jgi:hypothetical protein